MGPVRKDELKAPNRFDRLRQGTDQMLLTSERLLAEMQGLMEHAKKLVEQHVEIVKAIRDQKRK
jgi:hypothetical protein